MQPPLESRTDSLEKPLRSTRLAGLNVSSAATKRTCSTLVSRLASAFPTNAPRPDLMPGRDARRLT